MEINTELFFGGDGDAKQQLENYTNVHYVAGPIKQKILRFQALGCRDTNELEAIYYLLESHVPSLLFKTILRHEKNLAKDTRVQCLSKDHIGFSTEEANIANNVETMLARVAEMPPEWTLLQLTPHFNAGEVYENDRNKSFTNSLYASVFACGRKQFRPFCVDIEVPRDPVNGELVELCQEMQSIIEENKAVLMQLKDKKLFQNVAERRNFYANRRSVDDRLKAMVKDLQKIYLQYWRVLFLGKFEDSSLDGAISGRLDEFLKENDEGGELSEKESVLLLYLVKGAHHLEIIELKYGIANVFPKNVKLQAKLAQFMRNLSEELKLASRQRHPVILILDDTLDFFPWEMMDVLRNQPVSRLPSFHLAYALFKNHEKTIENGYKMVEKPTNGTYVVNPSVNLPDMENRITSFIDYWLPEWRGLAGSQPTEREFVDLLQSGSIFSYNGHGSGSQYISMERIEKTRTDAVVLLFGCSSTRLVKTGPQVEMFGVYQMYLVACSPCIVGMLWEVTDLDTDILTTNFLSLWVPGAAGRNWAGVDKSAWEKGKRVDFGVEKVDGGAVGEANEPDLLRALGKSKDFKMKFYLTRSACVARGIPVKIKI